MLREVIFRDDQKIVTPDLNNLSLFSRQSFDALVTDAVSNLRYFTGFTVTQTGQTEITVAAGRYWAGGPVYVRSDATVFNLLTGGNYMPAVTQRIVAVTTWGEAIETDTQERSFVIDDQGNTEPQSVAMERLRYARLSLVAGAESPDPQRPSLDAGVIPVAWVRLNTSGVVSIEMADEYRLPSVESLSQLIKTIEQWREQIGQILDTIQTELVTIQASIPPDRLDFIRSLLARIETLEEMAKHPASAVQHFIDRFLSERDSDTEYPGYNARVEGGLTFAGGAPEYFQAALNNPLDPRVTIKNDILTPKQTGTKARLRIDNPDGALAISQYTVQVTERVQKTTSRVVYDYHRNLGWMHNQKFHDVAAANIAKDFGIPRADATGWIADLMNQIDALDIDGFGQQTFRFRGPDGTPIDVHYSSFSNGAQSVTIRSVKKSTVQEQYWENVTRDATVTGSQVAQTFYNATNGWLTEIGIQFDQVGTSGDVHVYVVETEGGEPVKDSVISRGTIPVANLQSGSEVKCQIEPVYTQGGRSYAVLIATSGNHFVKVRSGDKYVSGAAYYLSDTGEWLPVQNSGDICIALYYPEFEQTRVEVLMQPLTRANGIASIRINAAQLEPKGTKLLWEVQRAGRWYKLSEGEYGALSGSPTLVNLRAVFIGTRDLMPGIDMSQTEIEVTGEEGTFSHVSEIHELDAATDEVKVRYEVSGWDEAEHDLDCEIILPGSPSDTVVPADAVVITPRTNNSTEVVVDATFTLSAATEYRVRTIGTKGSSDAAFVVTERRDSAY